MKRLILVLSAILVLAVVGMGYAADPSVSSKYSGPYASPFINATAFNVPLYSMPYTGVQDYKRKTVYAMGFTNNTSAGKQAKLIRQVSYSKTGPWFSNWSTTKDGTALLDDDYECDRYILENARRPVNVHFRWR